MINRVNTAYNSMLSGLTSGAPPEDKFTFGTNTKGDLIATHWPPHSVGGPVNSFNITEHIRSVVAEEIAKAIEKAKADAA